MRCILRKPGFYPRGANDSPASGIPGLGLTSAQLTLSAASPGTQRDRVARVLRQSALRTRRAPRRSRRARRAAARGSDTGSASARSGAPSWPCSNQGIASSSAALLHEVAADVVVGIAERRIRRDRLAALVDRLVEAARRRSTPSPGTCTPRPSARVSSERVKSAIASSSSPASSRCVPSRQSASASSGSCAHGPIIHRDYNRERC